MGGSETWTYTMAQEFSRKGHEVHVYTRKPGVFGLQMTDFCKVNPMEFYPEYDIILINHNQCLYEVLDQHIRGPKVFTSHSVYAPIEEPRPGADFYVAVSEEVAAKMVLFGFAPKIIRNPIDLERFKPVNPLNEKLTNVLVISDSLSGIRLCRLACKLLEVNMEFCGKVKPRFNMEEQINSADLVISLGRGAYEAMACGREVLVFDYRDYMDIGWGDGIITAENFQNLTRHNCSGRHHKYVWDPQQLADIMRGYSPEKGARNRMLAEKNLDVKEIVNQYLVLAGLAHPAA